MAPALNVTPEDHKLIRSLFENRFSIKEIALEIGSLNEFQVADILFPSSSEGNRIMVEYKKRRLQPKK